MKTSTEYCVHGRRPGCQVCDLNADLAALRSDKAALEAELASVRKELKDYKDAAEVEAELGDEARDELAAAVAERDVMRVRYEEAVEALRKIATHGDDDHECGHGHLIFCVGDMRKLAAATVSAHDASIAKPKEPPCPQN